MCVCVYAQENIELHLQLSSYSVLLNLPRNVELVGEDRRNNGRSTTSKRSLAVIVTPIIVHHFTLVHHQDKVHRII